MNKLINWSTNFAYAVGLITTDGCLSKDGRHIDFTSKDVDQIKNLLKILKLRNSIGLKSSGFSNRKYFRVQFGNVRLYKFLIYLGLTPHKSKTLGILKIPDKYFKDFLRGCLDGDGYTHSYMDKRWKNSFMLYTGLASASKDFLNWINLKTKQIIGIQGIIKRKTKNNREYFILEFAKKSSLILLPKLYYRNNLICLERKRLKIMQSLCIIDEQIIAVNSKRV